MTEPTVAAPTVVAPTVVAPTVVAQPARLLTVLIVDDSAVQRRFLRAAIEAEHDLTVVGEARNGRDAVAMVERLRPGAVLMDLDLPVMNGMDAIERIMARCPTPILVYSAFVEGVDATNAGHALAAGAVDVLAKPGPEDRAPLDAYGAELRRRLRVASRVRVITHPRGRLRAAGSPGPALGDPGPVVGRRPLPGRGEQANAERDANPVPAQLPVQLIVIGASTGGPQALATLLGELPGDLGPAILVVQHMAEGFIEGLAGWLDGLCALPVAVGENGRRLRPGTVTIAPSGLNLIVHQHLRVTTEPPPPTQYHVPGIDATFLSVARHVGSEVVAVLLTGMGRDGAVGLRALHDHGARTVAQDEATSAVYGMPAAAVALGAADAVLPLGEIGGYLLATVGVSEPVAEAGP